LLVTLFSCRSLSAFARVITSAFCASWLSSVFHCFSCHYFTSYIHKTHIYFKKSYICFVIIIVCEIWQKM